MFPSIIFKARASVPASSSLVLPTKTLHNSAFVFSHRTIQAFIFGYSIHTFPRWRLRDKGYEETGRCKGTRKAENNSDNIKPV